jgi:solute carrier family 8 (sodium/calcium exchanger)
MSGLLQSLAKLRHLLLLSLLLLGLFSLTFTHAQKNGTDSSSSSSEEGSGSGDSSEEGSGSSSEEEDNSDVTCDEGLVLPIWQPQDGLTTGDRVFRGIVYFVAMIYFFIGVSIVSDKFMESIEVITATEKEIKVKKPNGETQIVVVRVWNETVSNLTLMALGSSAPEILLSIIELFQKKFYAGDLGPGTIVGSAAFNLLVIIAICVYVIPDGEVRKIKHLRVFIVTASWSIFAYLWLLIILKFFSPGIVELWEGVVTFLFFPITVGMAYIADRRMLYYKFMTKTYRTDKRGMIVEGEGDAEKGNGNVGGLKVFAEEGASEEVKEFEESRREYIRVIRDLRKKHPDIDAEKLEAMAREEILNKGPKSRAYYRMQATRKLVGGQSLQKKIHQNAVNQANSGKQEVAELKGDEHITKIYFDPGHYTVLENVGKFKVTVVREGGDLALACLVDYATEDGTASGNADYVTASGTVFFAPNEATKTITLEVIDDDVFEEDEHFYVRLSNARYADGTVIMANGMPNQFTKPCEIQLATPFMATVIILDDDHHGVFNFGIKEVETIESVGSYDLKVSRFSGARGKVIVPFETEEGTAKAGKDFIHIEDELVFENNETE